MEKSINDKLLNLEYKHNNRYVVTFPRPFEIDPWACISGNRPSFFVDDNDKKIWEPITFVFVDPIGPSTSHALMRGYDELEKLESKEIVVKLELLDPTGELIEQWDISGKIRSINFGWVNYDTEVGSDNKIKIYVEFNVNDVTLKF